MLIFDAEFDGFNPTKIHCFSFCSESCDIDTEFNYYEIENILYGSDVLIGHNIQRFDIPHLERILNIDLSGKLLIDTLALSWYLYPDRNLHGLESWGEDFGVPKPKIDDWDSLTPEEYQHRCEEDVEINRRLWVKMKKDLINLYGSWDDALELIKYLSFKMDCAREQEKSKWKLDLDLCLTSLNKLEKTYAIKTEKLNSIMPQVPRYTVRKRPKNLFKLDGSPSVAGQRWFNLLDSLHLASTHADPVKELTSYDPPNSGSSQQVKSWLFSLGWKPENFNYVRDKQTNNIRKIPQIKNKEGDGVCDSVKKLYSKESNLCELDGVAVLANRTAILKGWVKNVDKEGYVKAKIQGLTNTLRFKHTVVVNLPGVDKPYGDIIRSCLIAPDGYELCGSDQSSLEDRTKQHFMWDYDPEYVKSMLSEDFDPHLDIAYEAKMMSKLECDSYKQGDDDVASKFKSIRHDAKQVNYSCTYGVTPQGLVRNAGFSLGKAEKLHKTYWKRNWAIQKIADNCTVKKCLGGKWLYNPVSKFWYNLRHEKDRFSTLNQGTGTFCFDLWVQEVRKVRPQLTGQFHDEIILTIREGNRDKCRKLLKDCVVKVNEKLKMNRLLDVDVQFGSNYAAIH